MPALGVAGGTAQGLRGVWLAATAVGPAGGGAQPVSRGEKGRRVGKQMAPAVAVEVRMRGFRERGTQMEKEGRKRRLSW